MSKGTAQGRYEQLTTERQSFLTRGRACSELTIPSLLPPEGSNSNTEFKTPHQSIGARGVNHLANKFLVALFPPNAPFFRLTVSDTDLQKYLGQQPDKGKVDEELARIERAVMTEVETRGFRGPLAECFKQLLVAGNTLLYTPRKGRSLRVFRLDSYVVKRDPSGNVLEIVTKEQVSPTALPSEVKEFLSKVNQQEDGESNDKVIDLYTHIWQEAGQWVSIQEAKGLQLPRSRKTYPMDKTPWLPLRFITVDGESYGRSFVEEYYGDLLSLNSLRQAIVQGAVAASKIIFLVRPNGVTRKKTIAEAKNLAVVDGVKDDVTTVQMDKFADFRVAKETESELKEQLSQAFLLHSSVQRNAERVTAEEIRFMAQELESALGGTYSVLAQELQLPLVALLMSDMERAGKLPQLPKGLVKPQIITGLEALGRGQDLNRLGTFLKFLEPLGPNAVASELNLGDFISRVAAAAGIETKGLVKTPDQKVAEQQQQQAMMQQQQMMDIGGKVAPTVAKGMMENGQKG